VAKTLAPVVRIIEAHPIVTVVSFVVIMGGGFIWILNEIVKQTSEIPPRKPAVEKKAGSDKKTLKGEKEKLLEKPEELKKTK
jgi:hypothetical protein